MHRINGIWLPDTNQEIKASVDYYDIASDGTYRFAPLSVAIQLCVQCRTAIDVGAHVGTYARIMSAFFSHVEAFEPWPAYIECFKLNVTAPNVHLQPVAVGDKDGSASLYANRETTLRIGAAARPDHRMIVKMVRLDSCNLVDVDLIKIDAEGYELAVLHGATDLLHRCHPVVLVEQKPKDSRLYGFGDLEAISLLEKYGAILRWTDKKDYCFSWGRKG